MSSKESLCKVKLFFSLTFCLRCSGEASERVQQTTWPPLPTQPVFTSQPDWPGTQHGQVLNAGVCNAVFPSRAGAVRRIVCMYEAHVDSLLTRRPCICAVANTLPPPPPPPPHTHTHTYALSFYFSIQLYFCLSVSFGWAVFCFFLLFCNLISFLVGRQHFRTVTISMDSLLAMMHSRD